MPGMRISLDAAMRARDISQPDAADRAKAEALADAGWSSGSDGARSSDRRSPPARDGPEVLTASGAGGVSSEAGDAPRRPGAAPRPRDPRKQAAEPVPARQGNRRVRRRSRLAGHGQGSAGSSPESS